MSPESFEPGAFIDDDSREWLKEVYESSGPESREAVEAQWSAAVRALMTPTGPWRRIADALRATTGRELLLQLGTSDDELDPGWLGGEVVLDGERIGGFGHRHPPM